MSMRLIDADELIDLVKGTDELLDFQREELIACINACDTVDDGYKKAVEEFREYLKTVVPCEMPQDIWNMGVDNTCDRMLKK